MVRIISIVVPWTILCGIGLVCSLKCHKARTNIRDTKTKIRMRKKKISWCKSMIPCIIGVAASWDPNCHGSAASQRAIVRNRHDNERRIIGISHLFQLCSRKEKGKETDLDVGVGFSNETFFHELPWQNASCLVTHTLERLSHRRRPLYAFSEEQHSLITKHRKDRKEYPERKANG